MRNHDVAFSGLDEGTNPQLMPEGALQKVENGVFVEDGSIRKRRGFESLSLATTAGGTITANIDAVAEHNGQRILFADGKIYTQDETDSTWTDQDDSGWLSLVSSKHIFRSDTGVVIPLGVATLNGRTVYLWRVDNGSTIASSGIYYTLVDTATGATVTRPYQLRQFEGIEVARVLAVDDWFCILWEDRGQGKIFGHAINSADVLSSIVTVTSTLTTATTYDDFFDAATGGATGAVDLAYVNTAGRIQLMRVDETLGNVATHVDIVIPVTNIYTITLAYADGTKGALAWGDDTTLRVLTVTKSDLSSSSITTLSSSTVSPLRFGAVKYAQSGEPTDDLICFFFTKAGGVSVAPVTYIRGYDTSADSLVGAERPIPDLALHTKPVWDPDTERIYFGLGHDTFIQDVVPQRSAYICTLSPLRLMTAPSGEDICIELEFAYGRGLHVESNSALPLAQIASPSSGVFEVVEHALVGAVESEALPGASGMTAVRFTSNRRGKFLSAEVGPDKYFGGGCVTLFDGTMLTEMGWAYYPWMLPLNLIASGTGGVADGDYVYRVSYEWTSRNGGVSRSGSSVELPKQVTTGPIAVNVQIPPLRLTRRQDVHGNGEFNPVALVVYRSLEGEIEEHHKLADPGTPLVTNKPLYTVTYQTHVDEGAPILNNELHYQDSGEVSNMMPPASSVIWSHNGALCGIDPEDKRRVWSSKERSFGVNSEHNSLFQARVDDADELTAGVSRDGKMIVFDESSAYIIAGAGFDRLASANSPGFQLPSKIPSSDGCIESLSLVQGGDDGSIYFLSKRGICRLPRGEPGTVLISQPIRETLETYPDCLGAAIVPAQNIIVWSMVDDADSPTAGLLVVWDYRAKRWATWTLAAAPGRLAVWSDRLVVSYAASAAVLLQRAPGVSSEYTDAGVYYEFVIQTGEIHPAALQNYCVLRTISVLGEKLGQDISTIRLRVAYNGRDWEDDISWESDGADLRSAGGASAGETIRRTYAPKFSRCSSFRIELSDVPQLTPANTPGTAFIGFSISYRALAGRQGWTTAAERG